MDKRDYTRKVQIMTQPTPNVNELLAQLTALQAQVAAVVGGAPTTLPADELPPVTIADVLKVLVRSARLADETTVLRYEKVIDDHFAAEQSVSTVGTEAPVS